MAVSTSAWVSCALLLSAASAVAAVPSVVPSVVPTAALPAGRAPQPPPAAASAFVLPPGQEQALEAALGGEDVFVGCKLAGAAVERSRVVARYRCGDADVVAIVRHRASPGRACAEVGEIAIETTQVALCAALSARFVTRPPKWERATTPVDPAPSQPGDGDVGHGSHGGHGDGGEVHVAPSTLSPRLQQALNSVDGMMRSGRGVEMLATLLPIAADDPHPQLLGAIVVGAALVAGGPGGVEAVDGMLADAAASPDDAIAPFVAGVAVHYRGHTQGATRDAKSADYRRAIALLEPLRERLGTSPRLWIYLAVSYVRTGRQADAEAAIAKAIAVDTGNDADVWYCRAEVLHRTKPAIALADIDHYVEIMAKNRAQGAWSAPEKDHKVAIMRGVMADVAAGTRPPPIDPDLFDPVVVAVRGGHGWPMEFWFVLGLLIVIVVISRRVAAPPRPQ